MISPIANGYTSRELGEAIELLIGNGEELLLREQAAEIRGYLSFGGAILQDWSCLIPAREHFESEKLFQMDLDSLFCFLLAPHPAAKRRVQPIRSLRRESA